MRLHFVILSLHLDLAFGTIHLLYVKYIFYCMSSYPPFFIILYQTEQMYSRFTYICCTFLHSNKFGTINFKLFQIWKQTHIESSSTHTDTFWFSSSTTFFTNLMYILPQWTKMRDNDPENFKNMYSDTISVTDSEFSEQKVIKQADADRCVSFSFIVECVQFIRSQLIYI